MGCQSEKGDHSSCHVLLDSEQMSGNAKIQDSTPNRLRYKKQYGADRVFVSCDGEIIRISPGEGQPIYSIGAEWWGLERSPIIHHDDRWGDNDPPYDPPDLAKHQPKCHKLRSLHNCHMAINRLI